MTPEIARNLLDDWADRQPCGIEFPVKDTVVCSHEGSHWTFLGLIKIAYNLTEAGAQKEHCHG